MCSIPKLKHPEKYLTFDHTVTMSDTPQDLDIRWAELSSDKLI